ncbi:MAG: hypothetical protein AB7F96_22285 [Beijerinckiaceae bacterium]
MIPTRWKEAAMADGGILDRYIKMLQRHAMIDGEVCPFCLTMRSILYPFVAGFALATIIFRVIL